MIFVIMIEIVAIGFCLDFFDFVISTSYALKTFL